MAKRIAMEFGIRLDGLISDEDVKEFAKKEFPFHSDKVKERRALEERQKRVMEFIQLVGAIFLLISVFCRIQLEMRVPMWCFILALCLEVAAFIARYRISKRLVQLY